MNIVAGNLHPERELTEIFARSLAAPLIVAPIPDPTLSPMSRIPRPTLLLGVPVLFAAVTLSFFLLAPTPPRQVEARDLSSYPTVLIRTADFAFDAPDTISAGFTRFELVNDGPNPHNAVIARLERGRTYEDLLTHLDENQGMPPPWITNLGGPNVPDPGQKAEAIVELTPGNYVLLCWIPVPGPEPHVMRGMHRPMTVVPATSGASNSRAPKADVVMTFDDFSFEMRPALRSGLQTIRFENVAEQPHEVVIVRLAPGKTAGDVLEFIGALERGETWEGPPPGAFLGGVTEIDRGIVNYASFEFTPGEYALICPIPDRTDGQPHFVHGMVDQITIPEG